MVFVNYNHPNHLVIFDDLNIHHHEQTQSELVILTGSAQVDELARMSGGVTITEVTRDHARSLLTDVK